MVVGRGVGTVFGRGGGKGIGSRVVKDLSYRRNLNLTSLIEAHAQPGQTLLVEAGANHWLALKDWLATRSLASS